MRLASLTIVVALATSPALGCNPEPRAEEVNDTDTAGEEIGEGAEEAWEETEEVGEDVGEEIEEGAEETEEELEEDY